MTEPAEDLARRAHLVGAELQALALLMVDTGWKPDNYLPPDVRELGKALQGMAMRVAMHVGDSDLLSEFVGRPMREVPSVLHHLLPPGEQL